jgi:hypothetical protein
MRRRDFGMALAAGTTLGAELKETAKYEQEFAASVQSVDIEIANGDIRLEFGARTNIRVEAGIEWGGAAPEGLALAKQELRFEPRVEQGSLRVWVERTRERWSVRYSVRHTVQVEMPANLRALARTSNGAMRAEWRRAPGAGVYLRTGNGEVELGFASPPDADFRLRTRNGGVYTAFPLAPLAAEDEPATVTQFGMRRIVSRTRYAGGRAGRGGPKIEAETMNGDTRLVERKA